MRALALPAPTISDALDGCINTIDNAIRRDRYNKARAALTAADRMMRARMAAGHHRHVTPAHFRAPYPLSTKDMTWLYDQRMVDSVPGRKVYETIKLAAGKLCPLCGQRDVNTLDHYFPKAHWPALAISPANLLPACLPCNTTKNDSTQLGLHPYFDQLGGTRWLIASTVSFAPMEVAYHLRPPLTWTADLAARMDEHFRTFDLGTLYALHADQAMREVQRRLSKILASDGAAGVRNYLQEEADSLLTDRPNSWRAALYETLATSPTYYGGAFANV